MATPIRNTQPSNMHGTYGMSKMNKDRELNASMTISPSPRDSYTATIHSLRGRNNG